MLARDLTLGTVPGGVDVAGLAHLSEETEVQHDDVLRESRLRWQLQEHLDHCLGEFCGRDTDIEAGTTHLREVRFHCFSLLDGYEMVDVPDVHTGFWSSPQAVDVLRMARRSRAA